MTKGTSLFLKELGSPTSLSTLPLTPTNSPASNSPVGPKKLLEPLPTMWQGVHMVMSLP